MKTRVPPSLGIDEARRLDVCRLCRGPAVSRKDSNDKGAWDEFIKRNKGPRLIEFAHVSCITKERATRQGKIERDEEDD